MSKLSFYGIALVGLAILFLPSNLTAGPGEQGKAGQGGFAKGGEGGKGAFGANGGFGQGGKGGFGGQGGFGGGQGLGGDPGQMFKQMFAKMDQDKDGKISKAEAPEQLQDRFGAADLNSDGFIDRKEQAAILEKAKQMAAQGFGGQAGQGGLGGFGGKGGDGGGFGFKEGGFGAKGGIGGKPKRPKAE